MKAKKCELCDTDTRENLHLDIMYFTGVSLPIPACGRCSELLKQAKDQIDRNKRVIELDQKIALAQLLRCATRYLEASILYGENKLKGV